MNTTGTRLIAMSLNIFNRISAMGPERRNSIAMMLEMAMQTAINLFVLTQIARALGPSDFGALGLAQATFMVGLHLALFANQAQLLKHLRDYAASPLLLLGATNRLKWLAALVVYPISLLIAWLFLDRSLFMLVAVYCLMHFVNVDVIWWSFFRSKRLSSHVLVLKFLVIVPFGIAKVWIAYSTRDPLAVAVTYVLESSIVGCVAWLFARRLSKSVAVPEAEKPVHAPALLMLAGNAWPLVVSATIVALYTRIDQFMINHYLGTDDVGVYTAMVRISEASTYIMATWITSRMPLMVELKANDVRRMETEIVQMIRYSLAYGSAMLILTSLFGEQILSLLFGPNYIGAHWPMVLHMLGSLFIYSGLLCTQWLILHDLQRYRLYRVIIGLVINVALNFWLIPRYGIIGAAFATAVSQFVSTVLLNAFFKSTRDFFWLQLQALGVRSGPGYN